MINHKRLRKPKNILLFCLSIFLNYTSLKAQDIFDNKHSIEYANHLYSIGDYENAAIEFKAIVRIKNENDSTRNMLIKSYCGYHSYRNALMCIQEKNIDSLKSILKVKYYLLLILNNKFKTVDSLIALDNQISTNAKLNIQIYSALLQSKKQEVINLVTYCNKNNLVYQPILRTIQKGKAWKYILASAIIPGLGKIIYRQKHDGAFALFTVGMFTTFSARAFFIKGIYSINGWIFGGLALGFYIGNIYGTYKLVTSIPDTLKEQIHQDIENTLLTY